MAFLDPRDDDPLPRDRHAPAARPPDMFPDELDVVDDDADDDGWDVDESWDDTGPDDDLPTLPAVALRCPGDVLAAMLLVVGPERSGPPALWFLVLDADDRPLPLALPMGDLPARPAAAFCSLLVDALAGIVASEAPGGSVAVAYVRAAGGDRGAFETSWDTALTRAAAARGLRVAAAVAIGARRARVLT